MHTYQEYLATPNERRADFIRRLIEEHKDSDVYRTALLADEYDRQRNVTAREFANLLAKSGRNADAARFSLRVTSNYFRRFNLQRCSYLLGNGVSFNQREQTMGDDGLLHMTDVIKARLGERFDPQLFKWGYKALIHGVAYGYWDSRSLNVYPVTQFAPLWDEDTGALRAGARFWRLDSDRPLIVEWYTEDGVWDLRGESQTGASLVFQSEAPRPYIENIRRTDARGALVVGGDNYNGALPVIPMYGSDLKQSTLVGFQGNIDAYDLIFSGLANDMREVAAIYWILQNQGGMTQAELDKLLDDIMTHHIVNIDAAGFDGGVREAMQPYTTEVPHQGRLSYLSALEKAMYKNFGALDVEAIGAGSTNDHIDAAYQSLDDEADQFEMCVIDAVQALIRLLGFKDTPKFRRNRTQNITEVTNAVLSAAQYLDIQTILEHLSFLTVDEPETILQRLDQENAARLFDAGRRERAHTAGRIPQTPADGGTAREIEE